MAKKKKMGDFIDEFTYYEINCGFCGASTGSMDNEDSIIALAESLGYAQVEFEGDVRIACRECFLKYNPSAEKSIGEA